MRQNIVIVAFSIMGIYFLVEYFKRKKLYNLLMVFAVAFPVFFNTPLGKNVSRRIEIISTLCLLVLGFVIIYLSNKHNKE